MKIRWLFALMLFCLSMPMSFAGDYNGKIIQINIGYDGKTITLIPEGWVRSDCTCYPTWPSMMCLDATRVSHNFEKALVLSAKARGQKVNFVINESSCYVEAMYELID